MSIKNSLKKIRRSSAVFKNNVVLNQRAPLINTQFGIVLGVPRVVNDNAVAVGDDAFCGVWVTGKEWDFILIVVDHVAAHNHFVTCGVVAVPTLINRNTRISIRCVIGVPPNGVVFDGHVIGIVSVNPAARTF